MKILMAVTLIMLGTVWLFYATLMPNTAETRALSDAMQIEHDLYAWAAEKVSAGKLEESDLQEIFIDNYLLRLGGENRSRNFHEMIKNIAHSSPLPTWPGVVSIIVGVVGAVSSMIRSQTNRAKSCIQPRSAR